MGMLAGFAVPHPPLIIPAVGRGEEKAIQDTIDAYQSVAQQIAALNPDVLVISSPHQPMYRDAFHVCADEQFHGSMAQFRAPHETVQAPGDVELALAIAQEAQLQGIPAGPYGGRNKSLDHATYIPLWFLAQEGFCAPVVVIGLSGLSFETHAQMGRITAQQVQAQGKRAVWIASGDLSHKTRAEGPYGYVPEGPKFDALICDLFARGAFDEIVHFDEALTDAAAECGLRSFQMMAGALEGLPVHPKLLSHQDTFGVGYGVATFIVDE